MSEASSALATQLDVPISGRQLTSILGQEPTSGMRLLVIRELDEDKSGVTLRFQQGSRGGLLLDHPNYVRYVQLLRRSQERGHPIGVRFGEGTTIAELARADNDRPAKLWQEEQQQTRVTFQGHDGIFRLQPEHSEAARIREMLDEAIRENAAVWFVTRKPDLAIQDVLPVGSIATFHISFVVAPDHLLRKANEILLRNIRCPKTLRRDIRAVAKAYIDEADELKRSVREIESNAQISRSIAVHRRK